MTLRILIADDEELARKRVARLLALLPEVELCGECRDGEEVLARVREGGIDVLVLDIQMPGLSGLEALALLPKPSPYVIFCTAHAEHAVEAFEVGAVDYVLKPVEAGRLQKALERARTRLAEVRSEAPRRPELERLAVPTRQGIVLLDPKEISHASLEGELVTIFTSSSKYLTDASLQELQDKLPKELFERVHRRALLNLGHVARLEPNEVGGYTAHTHRGLCVEVSRAAARSLRKRLGLRRGAGEEE